MAGRKSSSNNRRKRARAVRAVAARRAYSRRHSSHRANGDERRYRDDEYLASYRKGLPHGPDGHVDPRHYEKFRDACESLEIDEFKRVPVGAPGRFRKWESPTAGAFYELEGVDPQAVTMPPAPRLRSPELAAELAEVYLMAILRDVPFSAFDKNPLVGKAVAALNQMAWFDAKKNPMRGLSPAEKMRRRGRVTRQNLFRGIAAGDCDGPFVSQFLLAGNPDISEAGKARILDPGGKIQFGAQQIDQRVRTAIPGRDHMQSLGDWVTVQNGREIKTVQEFIPLGGGGKTDPPPYRFLTTPRDMATYVHFDQLYQAYLNACLILLTAQGDLDPGLPHQPASITKTKGFAQFGGPHVLTLVTEVATRALKAVRYQKFTNHRRARPEALAGLVSQYLTFNGTGPNPWAPMKPLVDQLQCVKFGGKPLLDVVRGMNEKAGGGGYFLPMAFAEGSPMHPAYGAGHATVAGACVTVLKAFFDTANPKQKIGPVFEANAVKRGGELRVRTNGKLTIEGELNKLAANISIARNMGGVHYFTDYWESLLMGEAIACSILDEQMLTYTERTKMTFRGFGGARIVLQTPSRRPKP